MSEPLARAEAARRPPGRPGAPGRRFGISLQPLAADLHTHLDAASAAEAGGLELVGIQDHP